MKDSFLFSSHRLRDAKMLLIGLDGLGAEICKNVVLTGIKSLTLLDDQHCCDHDQMAQFLIAPDSLGHNVSIHIAVFILDCSNCMSMMAG